MFIASMSHELRTPLNSIIGFTGVVLAGMAGELTAHQQDQLQRVYGSAGHLLALITDVIDISKIEAGFIDVFEERIEVTALVAEAVHTVQPAAREKKLEIRVTVPPRILVQADRRRLQQFLLSFVSNAVKCTVEGHISLEACMRGNRLDIGVEDTGICMDAAGLSRLFQPFELITFVLHAGGYATRCAVTGLDGLVEALPERPDFILLDIQLPDIDGLGVARCSRAEETGAPTPMIAATSFAMAGDRERVLAAGCNGDIEKPVDPLRVMAQIEDVPMQAC